MSALLGQGCCQKLYLCNAGLNSPTCTRVANYFEICQSYLRYATRPTRILQTANICSPDSHDGNLNTLGGSQLPGGLRKEHTRWVTNQAVLDDKLGASLSSFRMVLPIHRRPNGIIHGSFLVENMIQLATIAVTRYCNQQVDTKGKGGENDVAFCFLSSIEDLKYIRPFRLTDMMFVKANITATSDSLQQVEVSIERHYPLVPDISEMANTARFSFITNGHHDISQKAFTRASGDRNLSRTIPSKAKDSDHIDGDARELIPEGSGVSFIQPYDCAPPKNSFCRPGHAFKLMENHGIILASRLVNHDVVCVHTSMVRYHENIKMGCIAVTSGEVVSTTKDVLTVSLTVITLTPDGTKIQKRRVADGFFSYVPINSARERISIPSHQMLSGRGRSFSQDKEVDVNHNIVDSYVKALKNLGGEWSDTCVST